MEDVAEPTSKKQRKKQAKLELKTQLRKDHHAKVHELVLQDARKLSGRLQRSSAAVPEAALYARLPRAPELFADLPDTTIRTSKMLNGPANSWTAADSDNEVTSRSCKIVDRFLWRPHKYNEKYASQELSLLYQLYRLGGCECDLVVDIGGGNANLACLIALAFDVPVTIVEMETPREELRGELWLPEVLKRRNAVTRVESLIQDWELPPEAKNVLVLGKHLCGPGTDAGIDFVRAHLDRMLGCVFATCCCCKIVGGAAAKGEGTQLFADLYFGADQSGESGESCVPCDHESGAVAQEAAAQEAAAQEAAAQVQATQVKAAQKEDAERESVAQEGAAPEPSVAAAGFAGAIRKKPRMGKAGGEDREAWTGLLGTTARRLAAAASETTGDAGEAVEETDGAFFRRVLPEVARSTSWRNQVFNSEQQGVYSSAEMRVEADYFESWIQGFRRRRLFELFGWEEELLYCHDESHSQQNRCLVSGRQSSPRSALPATHPDSRGHVAFFALLEAQFLKYEASLPVDLRVRGLVSAKYDHDGRALDGSS
jgi:hypothetical protein